MTLDALLPEPRPALRRGPRAAGIVAFGALLGATSLAHAQPAAPAPAPPDAPPAPTAPVEPSVPIAAPPADPNAAQVIIVQQAPLPPQPPPAVVYAPAPAQPIAAPYGYRPAPYGYGYRPAPLPPRREPLRGTIAVTAGIGALVADSPFNRSAALWGYEGFHTMGLLGIDGGGFVTPWLMIGGRLGFGWAGAGRAHADQSPLSLQTADAGAMVRVGYPAPVGRTWWIFTGVQGTAGVMYAWSTLRSESRSAWLPRGSAEFVLLATGARVGLSLRVGYTFANWGGLGTAGEAQPVGGVSATLGLEVRL